MLSTKLLEKRSPVFNWLSTNSRLGKELQLTLSSFVFLTRLRIGFSHLREHKFRQGFLDIFNLICCCRTNAVEKTEHYILHCSNFANQRTILFDDLQNIGIIYGPLDSCTLSRLLLFGNLKFSDNINSGIIYAVIEFVESTNRFSGSISD